MRGKVATMLEKIEAEYGISSPLYCRGAFQGSSEIRATSFKGVLRFWWRALAWSWFGGDLQRIQVEEAALFGSAGGQGASRGSKQSAVWIRMRAEGEAPWPGDEKGRAGRQEGVAYLGYGLIGKKAKAEGIFGGRLVVTISILGFSRGSREFEGILDALELIGLVGGLGAKTRRGFGSLALQAIRSAGTGEVLRSGPKDAKELEGRLKWFFSRCDGPSHLPEYTALSPRAKFVVLRIADRKDPIELLDALGKELRRYARDAERSYAVGEPDGRRVGMDELKSAMSLEAPVGAVLGLPRKANLRGQAWRDRTLEVTVSPREHDRRGSPVFIHIHAFRSDAPAAVVAFLPGKFLPGMNKSEFKLIGRTKEGKRIELVVPQAIREEPFRILEEFIRRLRHCPVEPLVTVGSYGC